MNTKILRIELVSLLFLTSISFLAYFFGDGLGDNAFIITSDNSSIGFFGYYLSSFVLYIGYFTGPWLLGSFAIHMLSYSTLLARRNFWQDTLLLLPALLAPVSFCYLFFPSLLGEGLRLLCSRNVSMLVVFLFFVMSIVSIGAVLFRSDFFSVLKRAGTRLMNWPAYFQKIKEKKNDPTERYRRNQKFSLSFFNRLRTSFPKMMKGESKKKVIAPTPALEEKKRDLFATILQEKKTQNIETGPSLSGQLFEQENEEEQEVSSEDIVSDDGEKNDEYQENQTEPFFTDTDEVERQTISVPAPETSYLEMEIGRKLQQGQHNIEGEYSEIVSCLKVHNTNSKVHVPDQYFGEIIQILEGKLAEFDIVGRIVNIMKGPVVDTFELELGPGIPVTKVSNRSDDLSLSLKGVPVRIVYPMEGKTTVGIEVPREPREIIYLDQIINDHVFENDRKSLPIVMGRDAFGDVLITDLGDMPHMLVAGATGSGKSVFINTLLISLLVKKTPKDLKLILIDPKQLELALYHELPHLAMPVITEPKMAAISLLWAVEEMERRYTIMSKFGVRNIDGFNRKLESSPIELLKDVHHLYEGQAEEDGYHLPYVVIIIDEFADLILTKAGKEIELYVNRLAAKARAAGIHLIVATQRPSVKVITGNIKSNFPSRVAFKVMSGVDSRTILDSQGAEKLLGKGDMLFSKGVTVKRAHSAYVSDAQVGELVKGLNKLSCRFLPSAMNFLENGGEEPEEDVAFEGTGGGVNGKLDDRYEEALEVARSKGVVSASMLQRTMGIGYPKAAKIVDQMEKNGVIGPARGSKPREVIG